MEREGALIPLSDQLLLAQTVHQDGKVPPDWDCISRRILAHPCMKGSSRMQLDPSHGKSLSQMFSAQACEQVWTTLVKTHVPSEPSRMDRGVQLALAQRLYAARLEELLRHIQEKESDFRSLHQRIQDLREGKLDAELKHDPRFSESTQRAVTEEAQDETHKTKHNAPPHTNRESMHTEDVEMAQEDIPVEPKAGPESETVPDSDAGPEPSQETMPASSQDIQPPPESPTRRESWKASEAAPESDRKRTSDPMKVDDGPDKDDDLQVEQDLLGDTKEAPTSRTPHDTTAEETRSTLTPRAATTTYSTRSRRQSLSHSRPRSRSRSRSQSQGQAQEPGLVPEHPAREESDSAFHTPTPPSSPGPAEVSEPRTQAARHANDNTHDKLSDAERDKNRRRMMQLLLMLHNQVSNHTHANLFHQPIKEVDAPDYYTVVKQPMDLKLIKQRIKEGLIASSVELRCAFSLMYANALMYNQPGTEVHRMANEMRLATEEILDEFDRTPRG